MYMNCLPLLIFLLGLCTLSNASSIKIFKVLDTFARYRLIEKTALVTIKDLLVRHKGKDESALELLLKLYYSVVTQNESIDF